MRLVRLFLVDHIDLTVMAHLLAEHVTAVTVSVKDKLTLSLGVAVGSSIVSIVSVHPRRQHVLIPAFT